MPRQTRTILHLGALLLGAAAALPLAGCVTNAATGKSQLNLLSRSDEIQIGDDAMPQLIEQYGGEVPDPFLRQYISDLGMELVQQTEGTYKDLPWQFTFLNSPVINAFALPGGKVFITRGLVEKMTDEAQLAGVLGHEIGHVTAEHADKRISRQLVIQGIAVAGSIAASQSDNNYVRYGVPVLTTGAGVFALTYDRDEELEADSLGMRYMSRAGFDPYGQLQVMEILQEASAGSQPPEFLSTHPHADTRIKKIKKRLKEGGDLAYTQNNPQYELDTSSFEDQFLPHLRALPPMPKQTSGTLEFPAAAIACAFGHPEWHALDER